MDDPPPSSARKPCCVCDAPGGKHCTNCKSRHYCSKACQLVDWYERGHKAQCKQMAADFQDRLLDEFMPEKLKIKEEATIAVAPAAGSTAAASAVFEDAARLSVVQTGKAVAAKATALNDDTPAWRLKCPICLDFLPLDPDQHCFYYCCCKGTCRDCSDKCDKYDDRCPVCRALAPTFAEALRQLQTHADKGNAEAQMQLGDSYMNANNLGLEQSSERAVQEYERAAAQGHAPSQTKLGYYYHIGDGVKINYKTAAQWYRRAAEQRYPQAQGNYGQMFYEGKGVTQSYDEAVRWFRLAAAWGHGDALCNLGVCYTYGYGVPKKNYDEALRLFKRAAAKGFACATANAESLEARLAAHLEATQSGPPT